ncbi:hypothetical protein FGADI_6242 [Fusarium gaditjirri]|uniref:Uncharacterized protein n=1 Tax=Fusarium gaditjirri TaxID=282569 RepID=A0A8H4T821_9HYPO|nr:hypothetical protein FGADI_6242 [Fusarium gaditjirri]
MKRSFPVIWFSLLVTLLPGVTAYGERGIAERMLYWMAYMCEEQTKIFDPSYEYTVAPGCVGSRNNGRCSLDELLIHIWAKKTDTDKPDIVRPNSMETSTKIIDVPDKTFNQFEGALNRAKFNTNFAVDGNVDTAKLYPGATDYYDALSKMGRPIGALGAEIAKKKAENPNYKARAKVEKALKFGKSSAAYVFALRRKNMDGFRATFLRQKLSVPDAGLRGGFMPVFTNIDTAKTVGVGKEQTPESIPAIDFDATISAYRNVVPNIEDMLKEQNDAFMNVQRPPGEYINKNHLKAAEAARSAMTGCNCEATIPRELRKKRQLEGMFTRREALWETDPAAVHWGGPKAARSRGMRARRLANIGMLVKVSGG